MSSQQESNGAPLARAPTDSSRDVESLSKEKLGFSSPVAETVNHNDLSEEEERRLVRKVDLKVVPFIAILYFLSFLDRVNISSAAVFGLRQDLKLKGDEYNTALVVFFVPYIIFEIPSNALLKKFKPHVWLSATMFGFGFLTMMQGFTHNFSGLVAARFFLGFFEAGMFPGCIYLLSMWYKREEAQKRFTFFFAAAVLAGSFAGLLGYGIGHMDGIRGYRGWRWIFILEGLATCVISSTLFFFISDFPEDVTWLTPKEKAMMKARIERDSAWKDQDSKMTLSHVVAVLTDYKAYLGGIMYFSLIVPAYSFAYFVPSILVGYGYSAINTQLLSIAPYFAALVFSMIVSTLSDRLRHRFSFMIFSLMVAIAGFGILISVHDNTHLQYGALFLCAMGAFTAMSLSVCWIAMNAQGHGGRAAATAFQIGFGNCGGIVASYTFLPNDAPKYIRGFGLSLAFICLSALASVIYFLGISWENRKRRVARDSGKAEDEGSFEYLR